MPVKTGIQKRPKFLDSGLRYPGLDPGQPGMAIRLYCLAAEQVLSIYYLGTASELIYRQQVLFALLEVSRDRRPR